MREAMFIKKNAEKWKVYQKEDTTNPDEAYEKFITLMDDLAYAKTFYPKSKVTLWINGLAASVYQNIYINKKEKYSRIFTFWKYELPLIIQKHHHTFLFTTIIFCVFVAIGVFSSMHNPEFVNGILGNEYVQMTEDNIAKGDPFGVYKDDDKFNMFMRIGFNNIKVAFFTFAGGFILGAPTFYFLWSNGIMLGSFQFMFFANDLGLKSILVIWIHGTIEISSIIIAGAAGFILANGVLFPGTYKRLDSFKKNAKDAAKILICLIPFFIIAAFFESYITQLMSDTFDKKPDGIPSWVSVIILTFSVILIIGYFVIWPIVLHKKGIYLKKDGIVSRLQDTNV
ncbi:MAG: stage II sporulation protein M [Ferruginibacter sp.]|nr:stage II sporulation protein M [Ferruginibacter sp.]